MAQFADAKPLLVPNLGLDYLPFNQSPCRVNTVQHRYVPDDLVPTGDPVRPLKAQATCSSAIYPSPFVTNCASRAVRTTMTPNQGPALAEPPFQTSFGGLNRQVVPPANRSFAEQQYRLAASAANRQTTQCL